MPTFEVHDMTCGHCVGSITRSIHAVDPLAGVTADLATHRVRIQPAEAGGVDPARWAEAIREAGYTPVPVEEVALLAARPAPGRGCGCRAASAASASCC